MSSTLEGRCVNTIVRTSPKRAARGTAASAEMAARMLAPKMMAPSTAGSTPYCWLNQKAMKLVITNPPAKASSAKSADSRRTTRCD